MDRPEEAPVKWAAHTVCLSNEERQGPAEAPLKGIE